MVSRAILTAASISIFLGVTLWPGSSDAQTARQKPSARLERIDRANGSAFTDLVIDPSLTAADKCTVKSYDQITYFIPGWVIGMEWYKALIDPAEGCDSAYPFTVSAVNMPMKFDAGTELIVSVDIEAIDYATVPGCSVPGQMLTYSSDYELQVPAGGGEFNIWIPLDSPIVVDGPFFAGFYIANALSYESNAAVYTDSIPVACVSWDVWDESVGWVDLVAGDPQFPGRLVMEVSGTPGGGGGDPGGGDDTTTTGPAAITIIAPADGDKIYEPTEVWVWDSAGSGGIDYVSFSFSSGGGYIEFGRDYDGTVAFRDGINPATSGYGFTVPFDISFLPQGTYQILATSVDTLGDSSSTSIGVVVDPTPPVPHLVGLTSGEPVCTPMALQMTCSDEDMSYIEVYRKTASPIYSVGITPFSQFDVGDENGNPSDGNRASAGEFGDFYSAPAAAAMAARIWYNRGYTDVMRSASGFYTDLGLAEALGDAFRTKDNFGSYDDAVLGGLLAHFNDLFPAMTFSHVRLPSYYTLRRIVEDEGRTAILGLGGNPGVWVAVDGFLGWTQTDGTYRVAVANPLAGAVQVARWRHRVGYSEIELGGVWHRVDLMLSMAPENWTVTRSLVGVDFSGTDGWSVNWSGSSLNDGDVCFLRAIGRDQALNRGQSAVVIEKNCALVHVQGDYNDDDAPDAADLYYLIEYITANGPEPVGGAARADANCDNVINIADIVYYMNFLFGRVAAPCR